MNIPLQKAGTRDVESPAIDLIVAALQKFMLCE